MFDENIAQAFCRRAKAAKRGDNALMTMNAWSRLNGGKCTKTEGTFNTGCTLERVEIQKFLKLNMYPMDSEGSHKYKTLLLKKNFPTQLTQISICVFLTFS